MTYFTLKPLSIIFLLGLLTLPCLLPIFNAQKIKFTQDTGCLNDGSFEFCLPADDPGALDEVLKIAPQTGCFNKSRGRAGCVAGEMLCLVKTTNMCRPDQPHAMNDNGWQTVKKLADMPFIHKIVATWYE
jgi:hypothetical protein